MAVAHIIGILILIVALMLFYAWHKNKTDNFKSDLWCKDKIIDILKTDKERLNKHITSLVCKIYDRDELLKKHDIPKDKVSNIGKMSWICGDKQSLIDEDKPSKTSEK